MDPNETLRRIRESIAMWHNGGLDTDQISELIEHVSALDLWMSKGGFRPAQWLGTETDAIRTARFSPDYMCVTCQKTYDGPDSLADHLLVSHSRRRV